MNWLLEEAGSWMLAQRVTRIPPSVITSYSIHYTKLYDGLLGPNGAGKTTTIRIILDIFKADRGSVALLGGPMTEAKKDLIGS